MDGSKRVPRRRRLHVEHEMAQILTVAQRAGAPSAGELYRQKMEDAQVMLDKVFPWRDSYANWCTHLGRAAAQCNAVVSFGSDTYAAWESGICPSEYARQHERT